MTRRYAQVAFRSGEDPIVQVADEYFQVTAFDSEQDFWTARRFASGVLDPADASRLSGVAPDRLALAFEEMQAAGVAYDEALAAPVPATVPAARFLEVIDRYGRMWRSHLLRDPLFRPGAASPLTWLGFLVENAHRAAALPALFRQAADAAAPGAVRAALVALAAEEEGHTRFYVEALAAFDIDAERLFAASTPLLETRALGWFLAELSACRPLSLLAIGRLTEAGPADAEGFGDEAQALARAYGVPDGAVRPVLEHGWLDAGAQHQFAVDRAIEQQPDWTVGEIEATLQDMHDFRHAYGLFLAAIRDHYGQGAGPIPNTRLRWNDFVR